MIMAIAILSALCMVIGVIIGFEWGEHKARKVEAPVPVVPDYDPDNPMNGKIKRETVVICGREWEIMHP